MAVSASCYRLSGFWTMPYQLVQKRDTCLIRTCCSATTLAYIREISLPSSSREALHRSASREMALLRNVLVQQCGGNAPVSLTTALRVCCGFQSSAHLAQISWIAIIGVAEIEHGLPKPVTCESLYATLKWPCDCLMSIRRSSAGGT